ncbi:hypothetical protein MRS76_23150 [Rhizobiaceae bacterium n13]|uniref:Uncharacterized protein n=1 Tax=Ferirhizobium litorale TaxID=2927786 RepID=A0AAE3Q9L1_9HYPH|nr:hypothetical protein [Fererhizobium litorale]MDI7864829.1 hypothetical protein [Fererhizobium litorale]MDI7921757.1 hypothetical protein [Fererhizobium litorale]
MNRTLISALDTVNNLLALAIIIVAVAAGALGLQGGAGPLIGAVIGLVAGLVIAAVVCGLLAILIEIERNLRQLVTLQASNSNAPLTRQEPTLEQAR